MGKKLRDAKSLSDRFHLGFSKVGKIMTCIALGLLVLSSLMDAVLTITTVPIKNTNGVPDEWLELTNGSYVPDRIKLPVTYYDQLSDPQNSPDRQFEFDRWNLNPKYGLQQGIVQPTIGLDGLPVPTYSNTADSTKAGFTLLNYNITGNNPVQPTDNFYRWFHEVPGKSKEITGQSLSFEKISDGVYQYGGTGRNIFPLDNIPEAKQFSAGDYSKNSHNFYFTMNMSIPIIIEADGSEEFDFSGDDDVWVFLNGKLVLDIGGVHERLSADFKIGTPDASGKIPVYSTVNGKTTTSYDFGLEAGKPVQLQMFYAERNTSEANCLITIKAMRVVQSEIGLGSAEIDGTDVCSSLEMVGVVANSNKYNKLLVKGVAAWINQGSSYNADGGFVNFGVEASLQYSFNPDNGWNNIAVNPPSSKNDGFLFTDGPIELGESGSDNDKLYLKYAFAPTVCQGTLWSVFSAKTEVDGVENVDLGAGEIEYGKGDGDNLANQDNEDDESDDEGLSDEDIDDEPPTQIPEPEDQPLDFEPGRGGGFLTDPELDQETTIIADEIVAGKGGGLEDAILKAEDLEGNESLIFRAPNAGYGKIIFSKTWLIGVLSAFAIIFCAWRLNESYILHHNLRGNRVKSRSKLPQGFKVVNPKSKTQSKAPIKSKTTRKK
jgi:fibro-slime domain-containing protein